jgi:hypothetical protein
MTALFMVCFGAYEHGYTEKCRLGLTWGSIIPHRSANMEEESMNENFIQIKSLQGDLKISHKKRDFGITVSTKELVYQKAHANYHFKLEDIVSIMPFDTSEVKRISFHNRRSSGNEITNMSIGIPHYRFYVQSAILHNRSGIFQLGAAQFILPILDDLLMVVSKYAGLNQIK